MKKYIILLLLGSITLFAAEKETTLSFQGPEGSIVWHENKHLGKVPLKISVSPQKAYVFKFTAPGYLPQWEVIRLKGKGHHSYTLKLQPVTATVRIQSVPSGAELYINGKKSGTTPVTLKNLAVGKYSAKLVLPGFAEHSFDWDVLDERPIMKQEKLVSNNGTMEISSDPSGAKLWINGKEEGFTPRKFELPEGSYTVRLEKDNYISQENTVIVQRNKSVYKQIELQMVPAILKITSTPVGAEVFLHGKKCGLTPIVLRDIKPGKHEIVIQKEGFDPEKKVVELVSGKNEDLNVELASYFGSAELLIEPAGVTATLDGKLIGKVEPDYDSVGTKPLRLENIRCGKHELQLSHPHAIPSTVTYDLEIDREKMVFKRYSLWVPNCEISYISSGEKQIGILINETGKEILFSPEAGVQYSIFKKDIRIRMLKNH